MNFLTVPGMAACLPGLHGGERNRVDDVFHKGATAEVVHGLGEALEHRANGDGAARAALHGLVADVTGREAREHEHGRLAGDGAAGGLQGPDTGHGRRIVLQRAVHEHLGAGFLHELGGLAHEVGIGALAAVHGAVAQHGHATRQAKGLGRVVALHGDSRKFLGGRVQVDGAVAVNVGLAGHAHEEHGAHGLHARGALDHLQGRAQRVGGRVDGARNEAIDFAHLEHHGTKHHVVGEGRAGLVFGHALGLAEFHEGRYVLFGKFGGGFDDFNIGRELNALFLGDGEDFVFLADEDRHGDLAVDHELGGLHGTRFGTFGEHNALLGLGCLEEEAGAEHGLARLAFGGLGGEVGGKALPALEQAARAEQVGIFAVGIDFRVECGREGVVEALGDHVAHAGGAFHHDGVHGIKALLQEVGANLFHEGGSLASLDFGSGIGGGHEGKRVVGTHHQASLGSGVLDFLDLGGHTGSGRHD